MDLSESLDQQDFAQMEGQHNNQVASPPQVKLKVNSSQAAEFLQHHTGLPFERGREESGSTSKSFPDTNSVRNEY